MDTNAIIPIKQEAKNKNLNVVQRVYVLDIYHL